MNGPTSKGQMLNELVRGVLAQEAKLGFTFDVFLLQDSEDMLHPLSLKVINREITQSDFLQTPVFSMDRPVKQLVGGTYIEEFAELHTKDLFVRAALGAAIPSAGVGTAISRSLMTHLLEKQRGDFLREECLTEDYVLGVGPRAPGFKSSFKCFYREDENGRRDYIATREYFPSAFKAAVRQKSRWITGIVFQGSELVPWSGSLWNRYFLYRDRRGPVNSMVAMACTVLTATYLAIWFMKGSFPSFLSDPWFVAGLIVTLLGAINRLLHRIVCVMRVNGWRRAWAVVIRWPVGNLVNFCATLRAIKQYADHRLRGRPLKWVKTTHELPENFGRVSA
jgi:adsorption protein B